MARAPGTRRGRLIGIVLACVAGGTLLSLAQGRGTVGSRDRDVLERYQPIAILYDRSDWAPAPVESLLERSTLERRSPPGPWRLSDRTPTAAELARAGCGSVATCRLDLVACPLRELARTGERRYLRLRDSRSLSGYASVVYASARANTGRRAATLPTILQYWFFYPIDWWQSTLRRPAIEQFHEGDWESVTIALARDGTPQLVGYSQHGAGQRRSWAATPRAGDHPVVYVARGSHANYFAPGRHPIPPAFAGPEAAGAAALVRPLLHDYTCNRPTASVGPAGLAAATSTLVDVDASTDWARFRGAWGKGNFVFLTGARALFAAGASPSGPVQHAIWRDPVGVVSRWPVARALAVDPVGCPGARP